jgi:purine-binding chemotaxis protein CheW
VAKNLDASPERSLVGFRVGTVTYAIPTAAVRAIKLPTSITELPRLPPGVVGVHEHRGRIVPILDLRVCFGTPTAKSGERPKWIIVESGQGLVGLIVDHVSGVFAIGSQGLGPVPPLGERPETCQLLGVVTYNRALAFVMDLAGFHSAALLGSRRRALSADNAGLALPPAAAAPAPPALGAPVANPTRRTVPEAAGPDGKAH